MLIKSGTAYQAFVFVINADPDYLVGDTAKLKLNSFKHRDADFSGKIFYFTPKGEMIGGWKFKAGKIVAKISRSTIAPGSNKGTMETSCFTSFYGSLVLDNCMGTDGYMTCYYHWEYSATTTCYDEGRAPGQEGGGEPLFPLPPLPDPNDPALKDIINELTGCNGVVADKLTNKNLKGEIANII